MFFNADDPHIFRVAEVTATAAAAMAKAHDAHAQSLMRRGGLAAYVVHLAQDRTRVVTIEAWRSLAQARQAASPDGTFSAVYRMAASSGQAAIPLIDASQGVVVIDTFSVWRPLLRPVSAFNVRNGRAFNQSPGCVGTTVLTGVDKGTIATYAHWRSVDDFLQAFSRQTGRAAQSTDDVNRAVSKMTFGLLHTDYHSYDLFAAGETEQ
jgi:hypothetical protein